MRRKTKNLTRQTFDRIQGFCRKNASAPNTVFEGCYADLTYYSIWESLWAD